MNQLPAAGANLFDVEIFNSTVPKEGAKAVSLAVPFSASISLFQLNLLLTQSQQFMKSIQSVFVDNSNNGSSVTLNCARLNQNLTIPPNSQAYLPILASINDTIQISSAGQVTVNVVFMNVPTPAAVWSVI